MNDDNTVNDFTNYSGETLKNRQEIYDIALTEGTSPGYTSPLINSLRGLRILGKGPAMMPMADNTIGLSFVTRPQLNLTDENIMRSEKLISLFGAGPYSIASYVRGMLDEEWANSNYVYLLNNRLPFITCLTEYLKVSTGFNDLQIKIDTSEPGLREQVYQRVNSKLEENGSYTLSQTYYNPKPSVIQALFQVWEDYISEVVSGDREVSPRDKYLVRNKIDYDCRIYHLIMNADGIHIEHIFASVQSIPVTYPAGSISTIDNSQNTLRGEGQDDFSVQFASVGQRQDEWGLMKAFNESVYKYNPNLEPDKRNNHYREISPKEYSKYNYGAYPLILAKSGYVDNDNVGAMPRTGARLTWWVPLEKKGK